MVCAEGGDSRGIGVLELKGCGTERLLSYAPDKTEEGRIDGGRTDGGRAFELDPDEDI